MSAKYGGIYTALVTPFNQNKIDFESLEKLVKWQASQGVDGFVVNGTTGESPNITDEEYEKLFKVVKKSAGKDIKIIMGAGSNSTAGTIKKVKQTEKLGADALLLVVPYYNKPPQRGLVSHYKAVADSTEMDIILYNVPGRTITSLSLDSIEELSQIKNIVGIKEATGDIELLKSIKNVCGEDFSLLSGDDGSFAEFSAAGGHGIISVISHLIPKELKEIFVMAKEDLAGAQDKYARYDKLMELLYIEANPIPVKMAVYFMSLIESPEMRLPLVELDKKYSLSLFEEMKNLGLAVEIE